MMVCMVAMSQLISKAALLFLIIDLGGKLVVFSQHTVGLENNISGLWSYMTVTIIISS